MEACILVEREQDKVIKKLRTLSWSAGLKLQKLIDQVAELKTIFEGKNQNVISKWSHCKQSCPLLANHAGPEQMINSEQIQMIKDLHKSSKETCQKISSEHKEIHASISKFGRAIDKVSIIPVYFTSEPLC